MSVLAAGVLIMVLILIPPVVGVADNGDFSRVMGVSGIAPLHPNEPYAERYFAYAQADYAYGGYTQGGYVSTHILLVAISGWISRLFNPSYYDIRFLGVCYLALLLTAIALIVRHSPAFAGKRATAVVASIVGAVFVWVFADIGYVAYFHSFFGEPYALVGMLLAISSALALASAEKPSGGLLALFTAAALAVATAKIQNAPLGFVFGLLAWRLAALRPDDRGWRRRTLACAGILALGSAIMLVAAPNRLVHTNLYQSIFYGVLKDSPDVASDMRELGIPEKYAGLAGTNYFQKNTVIPQRDPTLRREVLEKLGHKDIALFYLKHPDRFVAKLKRAAQNGTMVRPYYLGNFEKEAGKKPGTLSYRFSSWSEWKHNYWPRSLAGFALFFFAYLVMAAVWWIRTRSQRVRFMLETLAVVAFAGLFSFVIPLIGDGEADLGKHLFMFNVCFDMMVVSVLVGAAYGCARLIYTSKG